MTKSKVMSIVEGNEKCEKSKNVGQKVFTIESYRKKSQTQISLHGIDNIALKMDEWKIEWSWIELSFPIFKLMVQNQV